MWDSILAVIIGASAARSEGAKSMANKPITPVTTIAEWKALPEIAFPALKKTDQKGSTYTVYKVAFLAATKADCRGIDISKAFLASEKYVLPMAVIDFDGTRQFCKVPLDLGKWAVDTVSHALSHGSPFPLQIEMGRLNGRAYVQVL